MVKRVIIYVPFGDLLFHDVADVRAGGVILGN
jgi:hypothetical protein